MLVSGSTSRNVAASGESVDGIRKELAWLRKRQEQRATCLGLQVPGAEQLEEPDVWVDDEARRLREREQENTIIRAQLTHSEKLLSAQDKETVEVSRLVEEAKKKCERLEMQISKGVSAGIGSVVQTSKGPEAHAHASPTPTEIAQQRVSALMTVISEREATMTMLQAELVEIDTQMSTGQGSPSKEKALSELASVDAMNEELQQEVADCDTRIATVAGECKELTLRIDMLRQSRTQLTLASEADKGEVAELRKSLARFQEECQQHEAAVSISEAELARARTAHESACRNEQLVVAPPSHEASATQAALQREVDELARAADDLAAQAAEAAREAARADAELEATNRRVGDARTEEAKLAVQIAEATAVADNAPRGPPTNWTPSLSAQTLSAMLPRPAPVAAPKSDGSRLAGSALDSKIDELERTMSALSMRNDHLERTARSRGTTPTRSGVTD